MTYRPTPVEVEHYRDNGYLMVHRPIHPADRFERMKAHILFDTQRAAADAA